MISSANLFDAPITFVGLTALSVDINIIFLTFDSSEALQMLNLRKRYYNAIIYYSPKGTCL